MSARHEWCSPPCLAKQVTRESLSRVPHVRHDDDARHISAAQTFAFSQKPGFEIKKCTDLTNLWLPFPRMRGCVTSLQWSTFKNNGFDCGGVVMPGRLPMNGRDICEVRPVKRRALSAQLHQ
jgi:hypothetical protein